MKSGNDVYEYEVECNDCGFTVGQIDDREEAIWRSERHRERDGCDDVGINTERVYVGR